MNKVSEINYEYGFDNSSGNSYLMLKPGKEAVLLEYQIEIICHNPVGCFVPFHINRENGNTMIFYNITSRIALSQYLDRKNLGRRELLELLININKGLLQYSNYMLELSGFDIRQDYIYINPATGEVSLVYIPIDRRRDAITEYRSFLKELLVESAIIEDNTEDNYLQKLLGYIKAEGFNLKGFSLMLRELGNNREPSVTLSQEANAAGTAVEQSKKKESAALEGLFRRENVVNAIVSQLLIILAAVIAILIMVSKDIGDTASVSGVIFIAAALEILIVSRIMRRTGRWTGADKAGKRQRTSTSSESGKNRFRRNTIPNAVNSRKEEETPTTRPVIKAHREYDTVCISDLPAGSNPFLEGIGETLSERIEIDKDKFIIGRLADMVDHVLQSSTIGKLHAEISSSSGRYYIRDLNSKNGTYINEKRIISNQKEEIKDKDRIRLSNHQFVFRNSQTGKGTLGLQDFD